MYAVDVNIVVRFTVVFSFVLLPVPAEELNEVQRNFAELLENFWIWRLTESPAYGTEYGFHSMDDQVEEYTEQAFESQVAKASEFLEETKNIASERLSKQEQMSLEILEYNLKTFIDGHQYRKFGMYNMVTSMERPTDEWSSVISNYKFESFEDYEKLIRRLRLLPVQIDQIIDLMKTAIANNITAHSSALIGCLENLKLHKQDNYTLSPMYRPFLYLQIFVNKTAKRKLREEASRVIRELVIPAWTKFSNFIEFEYSRNTRRNISVSSLPGGLEYYKACLKWHTSLDLTPDEIHQLGLQSIQRMKEKIKNVMDAYGFNGTARAFVQFLNKKAIYFRDTQKDLLEEYRNMIEFIRSQLHKVLISPPNISILVYQSENPESPDARYSDPTVDRPHVAYFYANVFDPQTRPLYRAMATTLHEAEPGHHTQSSYAKANNLPIFRRAIEFRKYNAIPFNWPFHSAYIEGWALYAEFLGEEMEVYPDKAFMFGRYSSEMLRNCRLVVDTGIHALGWTEEQAMNFLTEHSSMDERRLRKELRRYIAWPGEALSYKIGFMKIMELRREAEKLLGDKFDKREFHEEILLLGPCHLSMLESHIRSWIEAKLPSSSSSSSSSSFSSSSSSSSSFFFPLSPHGVAWAFAGLAWAATPAFPRS